MRGIWWNEINLELEMRKSGKHVYGNLNHKMCHSATEKISNILCLMFVDRSLICLNMLLLSGNIFCNNNVGESDEIILFIRCLFKVK
jgi:hypothetical protein